MAVVKKVFCKSVTLNKSWKPNVNRYLDNFSCFFNSGVRERMLEVTFTADFV